MHNGMTVGQQPRDRIGRILAATVKHDLTALSRVTVRREHMHYASRAGKRLRQRAAKKSMSNQKNAMSVQHAVNIPE